MFFLEAEKLISMNDNTVCFLSVIYVYVSVIPLLSRFIYILAKSLCFKTDEKEVIIEESNSFKTNKREICLFLVLNFLTSFVASLPAIDPWYYNSHAMFIFFCLCMLFDTPMKFALNKKKQVGSLQKLFSYNFWLLYICFAVINYFAVDNTTWTILLRFMCVCSLAFILFFNSCFYIKAKKK